jgi:hypothetical protein
MICRPKAIWSSSLRASFRGDPFDLAEVGKNSSGFFVAKTTATVSTLTRLSPGWKALPSICLLRQMR